MAEKTRERKLNSEYEFLPDNVHCEHSDDAMKKFTGFIIKNTYI